MNNEMANKPNYYNQCLKILTELHKEHPTYGLGQHLATAFSDYGDMWGISNKEALFALEKYHAELEYNTAPENEIERIIEEGKNLDKLFLTDNIDPFEQEEDM